MEESVTYQGIIEKGKALGEAEGELRGEVKGFKKALLIQGQHQFGTAPDREAKAALEAVDDPIQLEILMARLPMAKNWHDLLGLPARRRKR